MSVKIEKQPNGTYTVRVWSRNLDVFGKRLTKQKSGIKTVSAAKYWGNLTEDELTEQALYGVEQIDNEITFAKLNELYMSSRKDKMSPTSYAYAESIIPKILDYMGNIKAKHINTKIVQDFADKLANEDNKYKPGQKLKAGTIKRYINHINAVLNWGVAQDYLEFNRVKRIEYKEDDEPFEATTITAKQAGEILKWIKKNYYNIYIPTLLAVSMSPRRGELSGLKWDKVDFENDLIYLTNNRVMVKGKAIDKAKLKTKSSKRILVMSDFVKRELLAHKEMNQGLNNPYVCATVFSDTAPTNPDYITRAFHIVMEDEFGIQMRLHDLRHSFNQIAYEDDIDEATRSKIMGHSKAMMTRNTYTKASLKRNKEAMNMVSSGIEVAFNS